MKKRTTRQWLEDLPAAYRDAVLWNAGLVSRDLETEAHDLLSALSCAFNWSYSREGKAYWRKVCGCIERNEPLPPLPT